MKIIYYSRCFFADCDFPLIKELQNKGIDVRYYTPIRFNFQKASILEFEKPVHRWGIYKAKSFADMQIYKDCVDLDRLYFICGDYPAKWFPLSWVLWIWVYIHMLLQRADAIHVTWQFLGYDRIIKYLPFKGKRFMTVHDPVQHSGIKGRTDQEEKRKNSFKWADRFLLLNHNQVDLFSETYNIDKGRITISSLGAYTSLLHVKTNPEPIWDKPYILFFGQITPHKGVEYLLKAMVQVHKECPDVGLIIAGSGKIYFDYTPYAKLDYIRLQNYYIGVKELANLVKNSMFTVCPYKDATQSGVVQSSLILGKPVIVTRTGNLPEMIKEEKYGCVVPPCNSYELTSSIIDIIKNPKKLDSLVNNIKNVWLPSISWAPIADRYIELYNSK